MSLLERILTRATIKSALYDLHPELEDRVPMLRLSSEDAIGSAAGTFRQNAGSYTNHMWLQKAINVLANNISPLPVGVLRGYGSESEFIDGHVATRLLDNPNADFAPEDLWREWVVDQMTGGEWGLEVTKNGRGQPLELWPKQPEVFSVRAESVRYRRVGSYKIDDGAGEPYTLDPSEFIHFKFYNPLQPFRGLSPVTAIRMSIHIDQLAQAWSRLFFKNNARPDFAVIAPEGVTASERAEMITKLRADHSGANAHEPIVLEHGITDIKAFSWAAKDIEWMNQREMSRGEVAAIVGVPDEIMGYGKDTYENFEAAERILWTVTIVPLCGLRDGTLTRFFRRTGMLRPDERIATDLRNVSQLREDKSEKITQAKTLFEMGVPVNRAAEFLNLGLEDVPGGDIGYLNSAMVPVDQLPVQRGGLILSNQRGRVKGSTEYGSAEHDAIYKRLQKRLDNPVTEIKRILKREFQRQQNEINQRLREGKVYGRGRYKDDGEIPSPQSLFDRDEEIKKIIEALKKVLFDAVELIGSDELAALGLQGVFDITRPEVVRQITHILTTVATKVIDTTWTALITIFEEAERAGEGIPAIQERLSAFFGDRKSDWQTERIARTTMTGASNAGTQEAWNQAEADGVQMEKEWVSALQADRTREEHAAAHGQRVGLHAMFDVGGENLEYPGDPAGSPGNIINCFPADTEIFSPSLIQKATRRVYRGELVEIVTAAGNKLAGTPNHPILTESGWVPLRLIEPGQNVISSAANEEVRLGNQNVNYAPPQIHEVFRALEFFGGKHTARRGIQFDFHGDGMNSNIDVISTNRELKDWFQTALSQPSAENILTATDFTEGGLTADRPLMQLFFGWGRGAAGGISGGSDSLALIRSDIGVCQEDGFLRAANINTGFDQQLSDGCTVDPVFLRQLFDRYSRFVLLDNVVAVRKYDFRGHVYNLETKDGYYIANNIIAHNCLCGMIGKVKE